jgi:hypothetical protein
MGAEDQCVLDFLVAGVWQRQHDYHGT